MTTVAEDRERIQRTITRLLDMPRANVFMQVAQPDQGGTFSLILIADSQIPPLSKLPSLYSPDMIGLRQRLDAAILHETTQAMGSGSENIEARMGLQIAYLIEALFVALPQPYQEPPIDDEDSLSKAELFGPEAE